MRAKPWEEVEGSHVGKREREPQCPSEENSLSANSRVKMMHPELSLVGSKWLDF